MNRCSECIYFENPECHRYPPMKGFALCGPNSWCGEFKPKEIKNAIEERKIEKSSVGKHQGIDALGETTEASGSDSNGQGWEVQEKEIKRRGWPKGKPRK